MTDELTIRTARGEVITYRRGNEGYWSATQEGMPDVWSLSRVASRAVEALFSQGDAARRVGLRQRFDALDAVIDLSDPVVFGERRELGKAVGAALDNATISAKTFPPYGENGPMLEPPARATPKDEGAPTVTERCGVAMPENLLPMDWRFGVAPVCTLDAGHDGTHRDQTFKDATWARSETATTGLREKSESERKNG